MAAEPLAHSQHRKSRSPMTIRWMLWYAVFTHAWWGAHILLFGEPVTWITAIHHTMSLGFSVEGLGWTYLVISAMAAWGIIRGIDDEPALALVLPQQAFLVYSAAGAIGAVVASSFADGVVRPRGFISADQIPISFFVAVLHSCALLEPLARRIMGGELKSKGV